MYDIFKSSLAEWNETKSERQKLQHAYLLLTVAVIMAAGVASLFNTRIGHQLAVIALLSAGAFLANAVIWNLMNSALLAKLPVRSKRR